jgi:hypothetical protein
MLIQILALVLIVGSQAGTPTALDRLAGRWQGKGSVSGRVVRAELEFRPVLERRFVRLEYNFVAEGAPLGTPGNPFSGHAYYGACVAECAGHWFDSLGTAYVLKATQNSDVLTSEWSDGTTIKGKTEYRLVGSTGLTVTDWTRTAAGEWRQFGLVTYERLN